MNENNNNKKDDYIWEYFDCKYTQKERNSIVQKAKKIAKRSKYFDENFFFYDFNFWNKAIFLDESQFHNKNLFKDLNFKFVYYCWFVNICLFHEYGDDIVEFQHDCYIRYKFEELFEQLYEDEILYIKKELFYLDLVYYVLTDAKYKLTTDNIDNSEWKNEEVKGKKEHFWHVLYFPINLSISIHKDFL